MPEQKVTENPAPAQGDPSAPAKIPLSKGKFALVDAEDFGRLGVLRWYARYATNSRTWYAERSEGNRTVSMHRRILNAPQGLQVDHINGDGLDNRRANLRLVSIRQNQANRGKHCVTASPYKGVRFSKQNNIWTAKIKVNGKHIHLGCFGTDREAAAAYNVAAEQYFGEFARPNIIPARAASRVEG